MADTTNFGWAKPVVSGSSGAWGTILNDAVDAIDTDLQAVKDSADTAFDENVEFPIIPSISNAQFIGDPADHVVVDRNISDGSIGVAIDAGGTGNFNYVIPVHGIKSGMRITGFKSRGQGGTGVTLTVTLYAHAPGSNPSPQSGATLTHSATLATLTKTGLSISPATGTAYFFLISMSRTLDTVSPLHMWVQPVVERA